LEASTRKDPTSAEVLIPPSQLLTLPSPPMRIPSPPSLFMGDIPILNFGISLHDVIGEHNDDYFDSQEFVEEW
jgi:hypothetical protein